MNVDGDPAGTPTRAHPAAPERRKVRRRETLDALTLMGVHDGTVFAEP